MDDLASILQEAKYKQAMLDLKRRPVRRIPDLPRTKSSRKLVENNDVDLDTMIKDPIGVWFLRCFADLEHKFNAAVEAATEGDQLQLELETQSFADDSSVHGMPDEHEGTFLKFVNAFYARRHADPSNSVPRDVMIMLIRHYDLEQLEPVLRELTDADLDHAVRETLVHALDEAMQQDLSAASEANSEDENDDHHKVPMPPLLRHTSTIVDQSDEEHPHRPLRHMPGSVGSIEFPAPAEEAYGLPQHEDGELLEENRSQVDIADHLDDADDDDIDLADEDDVQQIDDPEEIDKPVSKISRQQETNRRRFSSSVSDLPFVALASQLRRANSVQRRVVERRKQIVSLRKLHSERTIGLNEAVDSLIKIVCEPIFRRFMAHKLSVRQYCRIKSFIQRPMQDSYFNRLRVLGRGATGRVYACMQIFTGRPIAMKVMPKKLVKYRRTTSQVKAERRVLEALARKPSPYCMRLLFAYQTKESFHFVLPLAIAGDLRFHLSSGPLSKKRALVYAAEVACGLGHIHSLGYVMRDLKPRNILLDAQGRCRISDFGLAVNVGDGTLIRGRAGTVGYWAPQVLSGERYGQDADWWSYGVCVYEFFAGFNPFSRRFTGCVSRNEATLHAQIRYPPGFPENVEAFVSCLLQRDVSKRLGCRGRGVNEVLEEGAQDIWRSYDLDAIRNATHKAVWMPMTGVIYAESESEIAANEEKKLPDVHKVRVNPGDMPPFDDFVALYDYQTDLARVMSFHIDQGLLQSDILSKYKRGKLPHSPVRDDPSSSQESSARSIDGASIRTNSKCLVM